MPLTTSDARLFLVIGAAGAFAAHALRGIISPGLLDAFLTGVHYQAIHSLALLLAGILLELQPHRQLRWAGWCFASGILLFCGSLYIMAAINIRWLGLVTPFGGTAFLCGWGILTWHLLRR